MIGNNWNQFLELSTNAFSQEVVDMAGGFKFGDNVGIWDLCEDEKVKTRIEACKDPSLVLIYGLSRKENCIVVLFVAMFECFKLSVSFSSQL
jgi:hypothetical protein